MEKRSLASAILASSETVGKDCSRYPRRLALFRSFSRRSLSEARVRPHQDGEAYRSLATVVALVTLWMDEEERPWVLSFLIA